MLVTNRMITMADLTQEEFEQLPESVKAHYTEVEGAYKHIALMTVKKTADNLDADLKKQKNELLNVNEQLHSFEELKTKEIQAAHDKALEEAREANNVDVILKLEREKMEDERKIINKDRAAIDDLQAGIARDKKTVIADRLTQFATDEGKEAFNLIIQNYIDVNKDTRTRTFLTGDGSASSLDNEADFLEYLKTLKIFKPLLKATATTRGGGMANGSIDGSASSKKPEDMTGAERLEWKKRDLAGFKKYYNLN